MDWEWVESVEYLQKIARTGWFSRMLDLWRDYVSDEDWPAFVSAMEQRANELFGGAP